MGPLLGCLHSQISSSCCVEVLALSFGQFEEYFRHGLHRIGCRGPPSGRKTAGLGRGCCGPALMVVSFILLLNLLLQMGCRGDSVLLVLS